MTPLHLMSRQTALAYLFLGMGVAAFTIGLAPPVVGYFSHPRAHLDPLYPLVVVGFLAAILGGWLLPESGAPTAVTQIVAVVGPYLPRIPGLSRVGDPKPTLPPPATGDAKDP